MGLFNLLFGESKKLQEISVPTFIKDFSKENQQINDLEKIYENLNDEGKRRNV